MNNNDLKSTLPFKIQVLYGIGVSYAILDQIFVQWVLYYYLPPENSGLSPLISPLFITIALLISRFIDMIFDPIVGYSSDNFKSRWGRRIPFIFLGSIPLCLSTIGFFYPLKNISVFIHLTVMGSLFFIFYSVVGAPYNALIPEISKSYEDRLNLSTWQSVFRLIYSAIAMIIPGILILKFACGNEELGIRKMVIFLSTFSLIGMFITSFFVKEKKYSNLARGGDVKEKKIKFRDSIKIIFSNKNFIYYIGGLLFFFIGFNTLRTCINYYVEDIMGYGKDKIAIVSGLLFLVSGLFFYPVNRLSRKYGYRKLAIIFLLMLIFLSLALFNLGKMIDIKYGYIIFAAMGIPISGCAFIFPPAMLSEIISKASLKTEGSFDGLYFGVQGFFLKLAFFISIGFVPLLLVSGGENKFFESIVDISGKVTTGGIYLTTLFSTVGFLISLIFYYFYNEELE